VKVLQIATSTDGGAGIAARRLNEALNSIGNDSNLLTGASPKLSRNKHELIAKKNFVARNLSRAVTVSQAKLVQNQNLLMTPFSKKIISVEKILSLKPDIIHLHTFYNFLDTKTILEICNSGIPIFISLHDERFYTGGCHHALNCLRYEDKCSNCPEARTFFQGTVARAQNELTHAFGQPQTLTVIAPSDWIANRARSSKVLRTADVVKINNPLGAQFIASSARSRTIRDSSSPFLVTFVAQDLQNPFKGLETLLECISKFENEFRSENIQFIFVGKGPELSIGALKARQYKKIDMSKMIDVYLDSDLLVVPSLVDNSPNVIFEALACGTPFVGSDRAGIPEISEMFGMESFKYGDPDSMYKAILNQRERNLDPRTIREAALALVHPEVVAQKFAELYRLKSTEAN
jgi:glycosyltransferase involved in cell wall biosynthesis